MPPRPDGEFRRRRCVVRYGEGAGQTPRLVRAFGAHADDRGTWKVPPLPGALRPTDRGEGRRRGTVNLNSGYRRPGSERAAAERPQLPRNHCLQRT
jgi:hypothetical protein